MSLLAGILNLDKPAGISSARAVAIVKRQLPRGTKIGHAGTLDPFATGVLLLLVGRATKACEGLMDAPKTYDATVRLGATTATDDPEGEAVPWARADGREVEPPAAEAVVAASARFVGTILQRPPAFSAMKVGGRRAYTLARGGADVQLAARPVRVYGLELLGYAWPEVRIAVRCGRGTYVRAIARDLGEALDCGGHLTALRRTASGGFRVEDAATLEEVAERGVEPLLKPVPAPPPAPAAGA
ncbi:MAG: tRNA pseudouridine synthase [Phycisphaerales bacterium]|nr:tRNA pseudouridine synthase [Phycisphaerales bacterium]